MKDDSSFWVEESSEQLCLAMKRKRKARLKKLKFIGWGSKPLIEFLESNGKDTSKQLKQYDVTAIVNEYVKANNLVHPEKKKKIMCDQWLYALFGKKFVPRIKIYDLLEPHFVENHDSSEDDSEYSLEEEGTTSLEKKASNLERNISFRLKKVPETPKSCFAAVIPENIKLVYLKRSLVLDLLKAPENFEDKVMGSFVRIKSDPNDYLQKNSHQLQQIIGVRMTSEADDDDKMVHLRLSSYVKEIPIQMLSDDNFTEAECQDLRERVKAGLLERPTVVELELKAKMLHKDIMKHWIPREIAFLQNLINRANEKGWRREYPCHTLERLLAEIPKVIADELEPEAAAVDTLEKIEEENTSSPKSSYLGASNINFTDDAGCGDVGTPSEFIQCNSLVHGKEIRGSLKGVTCVEDVNGYKDDYEISGKVEEIDGNCLQNAVVSATMNGDENSIEMEAIALEENGGSPGISAREVKPTQVIELSDDESEVEDNKIKKHTAVENPEDCVWHYVDPQGVVQGPFSIAMLKRWNDANYFDPDFTVWKVGQTHGVLLIDALRQRFPL
ncbi:hypothetical protein ACH5RR_000742 [Cinchona calisaya]|uniref:Uncharacterized protein n=1 Tax=Cinchona calisaya TaxID=153742 RepID=A0ABD3B1P7_9GENT